MVQISNYRKLILFGFLFIAVYILLVFRLLNYELLAENSTIQSLSDAVWYSIVTLTTVGYGDIVPKSDGGRIIGYIFLFLSLGVYGILIGQFSNIISNINENNKLGMQGTSFQNHIVVIGWTQFGKTVIDQLIRAGRKVAIVTKDRGNIDLMHEIYDRKHVFILYSDYENFELLEKANIEKCSSVFINLENDTDKLVYILNIKKCFSELQFIVTLENANLKQTFISAGVKYAISKNEIASRLLASYMFEPDVAQYSEEILAYPVTETDYDIKQFRILSGNPFIDQEYDKSFYELKKNYNVILIGLVREEEGTRTVHKNPQDNFIIREGDFLMMIMNLAAVPKIKKVFSILEGI
jgi:voltage-gated potassium channel